MSDVAPNAAADPLIGQVIADRYHILSLIGEGGMGRVYVAEHVRMGRRSAVKVMSPNLALAADAISRFNREAANASRINHPNVAQIYDFGETSTGLLYLAMELIEGRTLRAVLETTGPLPLDRAAMLTSQIADALAAAHHLGIVHRDLKPDNVMLTERHDGSEWVKVVDFGIAKTVRGSGDAPAPSQTVTTAGVSLGTPEYMSPEQLAGERLDHRTDLYSLALLTFNMVTGDLPYPRVTSRETLVRRLTSRPQTLAEVSPRVPWPPALQQAFDRALAPQAEDRYPDVLAFAHDVNAAVNGGAATVRLAAPAAGGAAATRAVGAAVAPRPVATKPRRSRAAAIVASLLVVAAIAAGALWTRRANTPMRVATVGAPAPSTTASATPTDTAPAPIAPAPRASTPAVRSAMVPTAHAPVPAAGDTSALSSASLATTPTSPEPMQRLERQIRAHAFRAGMLVGRGNVTGSRNELRDMANELQTFRTEYPGAADSLHIEQQARAAAQRVVQRCRELAANAAASPLPNGFDCADLISPGRRGRGAVRSARGFSPRPY